MDEKNNKRQLWDQILPHLIYLGVAFWITSQAWLKDGLILSGGDQPDWNGTAWAYWWVGKAIEEENGE